ALYAGVEFGSLDTHSVPDSVEFTASSIAAGGMVQVWLDSIDSGVKLAECAIGNTGSWTVFKKYKTAVTSVEGNHDVYLKFVGSGINKLFQLRWMSFSKKAVPVTASAKMGDQDKFWIYPNPAKDKLSIYSGFQFNKVEIFSMNGRMVFQDLNEATQSSMLNLHLDSGMYVLKISSQQYTASSKLMIGL
ncbi:MAG TPA: hypothetical protein DCL77_05495, partial [Prolixibacteraceae bacterium]|nr:hypothetical protein [Prolixibacteraceae bacterium]